MADCKLAALLLVALLAGGAHAAQKDAEAEMIDEAIAMLRESLINADWTAYNDASHGAFTLTFNTTSETASEVMDVIFGEVTQSAGEAGTPSSNGDRDTLVQIKNTRAERITVYIGISDVAAIDPGFQIPHWLATGDTISKQNWNSFTDYDVISNVDVSGHDEIRIEVGNPKIGYPWVKVCGDMNRFYENEVHIFSCNGVDIRATRKPDAPEAKMWLIEVL